MNSTPHFTSQDHLTWTRLFAAQSRLRDRQIVPVFSEGLKLLGITESQIPDLQEVNRRLKEISGWQAVYSEGFVAVEEFFQMLSQRKFPVGNFIRDAKDLNYTPAPDVFHDLYGHIPFYVNQQYADFCQRFGLMACQYADNPDVLEAFQRLFWFTIEFALLKTPRGNRIFGAGIASSISECEYALSEKPKVHPFDLKKIRNKSFRIDEIQNELFILDSEDQLYTCLSEFKKLIDTEEICIVKNP